MNPTIELTDYDIHLFQEGSHFRLYEKLGAHVVSVDGRYAVHFAVWAPNAASVHLMGNFNGWDKRSHPLEKRENSGIWEGVIGGIGQGEPYKYHIVSNMGDYEVDKSDPFAFYCQCPPQTASIVWGLDYTWEDGEWMRERSNRNSLAAPISVYEMHLGSWRRVVEENNRPLTYRELADVLPDYVHQMGFTHVEFLPLMEHPFYGSWGYQTTGFFAPSSRYGAPQDLMLLIDRLHQRGIGVILDWVPSHFPDDEHGLVFFDGTQIFEHKDRRQGFHPDWNSYIFNYGRNEVRNFLISSALFWLDRFHADGVRVDAVASMLYLDYSRKEGEWIPNRFGGRENLEAIDFLRRLNLEIYQAHPDVQTIAEESTAWPMVSRPLYVGGLGFGMKWDMGWMHDTLDFMALDPIHRQFHQNQITFRQVYAGAENYMLPLSHDEVVYGKKSLLSRMPGDWWRKFANLRLLLAYMYVQNGKKLLFMGGEFGQWNEWSHESGLDWSLLSEPMHQGIQRWVQHLNWAYRHEPALHQGDAKSEGFRWIDCSDSLQSVLSILRRGDSSDDDVVAVLNFTPVPRTNYRVGVPRGGTWHEILNSDAPEYGGAGWGNMGAVEATPVACHGHDYCLNICLPPLGAVFFKCSNAGKM